MSNTKMILDLALTLDGIIDGPNGEVDWCIMDSDYEFERRKNELFSSYISFR